jgi:hypothetical protein
MDLCEYFVCRGFVCEESVRGVCVRRIFLTRGICVQESLCATYEEYAMIRARNIREEEPMCEGSVCVRDIRIRNCMRGIEYGCED